MIFSINFNCIPLFISNVFLGINHWLINAFININPKFKQSIIKAIAIIVLISEEFSRQLIKYLKYKRFTIEFALPNIDINIVTIMCLGQK